MNDQLIEREPEKAPLPAVQKETSATAVAVTSRAEVEARYAIAQKFPRSWMDVRNKMLEHCKRVRFAATARYAKPIGKGKVMGWSIRFAEAFAREMGNIYVGATVMWDDDEKRIVRITVTDLESNTSYPIDVVINKTLERYSADGYQVLSSRQKGDKTLYIVKANDDDILTKQNAIMSKAIRNGVLRMAPGDILDECFDAVQAAAEKADKADPQGEAKKISAAFYEYGVSAKALAQFLGKADFVGVTPEQVGILRTAYVAIKDGETTWEQIVAAKEEGGEMPKPTASAAKKGAGAEALRQAVGAKPAEDPDLKEDQRITEKEKEK